MVQAFDISASVGSAVADAESDLLFGRERELATLQQYLRNSRQRPLVVYVHGTAGSGKSATLRAVQRCAAAEGVRPLLLDGAVVGPHADAVLADLHQALLVPGTALPRTPEAVVRAINATAADSGILLVVDHYDHLVAADAWFRREILYRCGPGVCVLLAGRRSPDEAWPGDRAWRAVLRPLPMEVFTTNEARAFLEQCGLHHFAAREEALELAGTSPALLAIVADALTRLAPRPEGAVDEVSRWSALIEQILHPGSRRSAWRAGLGSSEVDRVLAAASLLPSFDRELVAAMVGQATVDAGWPQVMGLRLLYPWHGGYRLHETVREPIRAVVLRQRPWAQGRWRHRALTHALGRSFAPGGYHQEQALLLALHGSPLGERLDDPDTRLSTGVAAATECEEIARACRMRLERATTPAEHAQAAFALGLLGTHREAFRVTRGADGQMLGYSASLPPSSALDGLLDDRRQLATGNQGAATLMLCLLEPTLNASGVREALLRDILMAFARYERVVSLLEDPGMRTLLTALGFRDEGGVRSGDGYQVLDFAQMGGWSAWLRQLGRPQAEEVLPAGRHRQAARDALAALHDDERLSRTAAARHYAAAHGQAPVPARVRAWLLDALESADLGGPAMPGREVLRHYYVQRSGSHEAVAEELGASRATYFRWHRQALDRFGESLFS